VAMCGLGSPHPAKDEPRSEAVGRRRRWRWRRGGSRRLGPAQGRKGGDTGGKFTLHHAGIGADLGGKEGLNEKAREERVVGVHRRCKIQAKKRFAGGRVGIATVPASSQRPGPVPGAAFGRASQHLDGGL
jgi:hypothetical protein